MKYIINESQLDKVVFRYLDMELDGTEERKGTEMDIVIGYPDEKYGLIGIEKMGDKGVYVFVSYGLFNKIIYLFSMENSTALELFGRYVENRYNLEVIHTFWPRYTID